MNRFTTLFEKLRLWARTACVPVIAFAFAYCQTGCQDQGTNHPITPPAVEPKASQGVALASQTEQSSQSPSTSSPAVSLPTASPTEDGTVQRDANNSSQGDSADSNAAKTDAVAPRAKPGLKPSKALKPDKPSDGRTQAKSFDDIKFDIEPDAPFDRSMLTDEITELDDQRIRIRGFILPTAQKRGIKTFVLVRDNMECCFGPGAALYDCILIEMAPGETAEFTTRPVAVEGDFHIKEYPPGADSKPLAIYRMTGEKVEK